MLLAAPVDDETVGQRLATLAAAVAAAAIATAAAPGAAGKLPDWAAPQIATVVSHGLMGAKSVQAFQPNAALKRQTLSDLAFGLQQQLAAPPPLPPADTTTTGTTSTDTTGTDTTTTSTTTSTTTTTTTTAPTLSNGAAQVSMAELDRRLVLALGLGKAAKEFALGARAGGAAVPGRFGTEVVARLLGLRINHPAAQDFLELRPQDPATRAEAAYSAAQILNFGVLADSWQVEQVQSLADSFVLPQLTDWQRRILNVAFSKIGMPYVWGGVNDGPEVDFGVSARGGYDCSGFIWRVYKLQSYPNEGTLASTIQGRTTYTMSVEVPRSERISFAKLQPADVIFFGTKGARSTGPQIFHAAIYVGNGWFIQSSDEGVALAQLSGWSRKKFAWGRSPLREAGLEQ
jgi:cell wall-associated NlpC family hydrolase